MSGRILVSGDRGKQIVVCGDDDHFHSVVALCTSGWYCKDCGDRKLHGQFLPWTHAATFSGISLRDQLVLERYIVGKKRDHNSNRVLCMNMYELSTMRSWLLSVKDWMAGSSCESQWVLMAQSTISSGWTHSSAQKVSVVVIGPSHHTWTLSQTCDSRTLAHSKQGISIHACIWLEIQFTFARIEQYVSHVSSSEWVQESTTDTRTDQLPRMYFSDDERNVSEMKSSWKPEWLPYGIIVAALWRHNGDLMMSQCFCGPGCCEESRASDIEARTKTRQGYCFWQMDWERMLPNCSTGNWICPQNVHFCALHNWEREGPRQAGRQADR